MDAARRSIDTKRDNATCRGVWLQRRSRCWYVCDCVSMCVFRLPDEKRDPYGELGSLWLVYLHASTMAPKRTALWNPLLLVRDQLLIFLRLRLMFIEWMFVYLRYEHQMVERIFLAGQATRSVAVNLHISQVRKLRKAGKFVALWLVVGGAEEARSFIVNYWYGLSLCSVRVSIQHTAVAAEWD